MSEKRARYTGGSLTGVEVSIPFDDGHVARLHITPGSELPSEVDGRKVPASFRDGLLAQTDNWSEVKRATGADATGKTTAEAAKEGDR